MEQRTQEYLDAAKLARGQLPAMRAALMAALPPLSEAAQLATALSEKLVFSQLVEAEPAVAGKLNEIEQRLGALLRLYSQLSRELATFGAAWKKWDELDAELRAVAQNAGYSV